MENHQEEKGDQDQEQKVDFAQLASEARKDLADDEYKPNSTVVDSEMEEDIHSEEASSEDEDSDDEEEMNTDEEMLEHEYEQQPLAEKGKFHLIEVFEELFTDDPRWAEKYGRLRD